MTEALVISAVAVPVVAVGVYIVLRIRRKPKDKEKRRRLDVNSSGRLGDATILMTYTAAQDISKLRELIPGDPERLIGRPASLKYSSQNPANSILLCEEWSGLRVGPANQPSGILS
jgi:hypothetical protein